MINCKSGDVVVLEVIFSNGSGTKKRPALVISSDDYHAGRSEIIIAAITSNIKRVLTGDSPIENWKKAGLLYPSIVTGVIQTVKRNMIIRKLGRLSESDYKKVKMNLGKAMLYS